MSLLSNIKKNCKSRLRFCSSFLYKFEFDGLTLLGLSFRGTKRRRINLNFSRFFVERQHLGRTQCSPDKKADTHTAQAQSVQSSRTSVPTDNSISKSVSIVNSNTQKKELQSCRVECSSFSFCSNLFNQSFLALEIISSRRMKRFIISR